MDALKKIADRCFEEWRFSKPSYYTIETYAEILLKTIKEWRLENPEYSDETFRIQHKADILNADIEGELKHDFEKNLKRYKEKWIFQKNNLDALQNTFRNIQKKSKNNNPLTNVKNQATIIDLQE